MVVIENNRRYLMDGNNTNNINGSSQVGGNFDSNNSKVSQHTFASLTAAAKHVIARSAHSDTLEVGGYDPEISLKLSIASAQNDNYKSRIMLNTIAKELLAAYSDEFEMDIETAYYNFKNGLPNVKGLETAVVFMGCMYRNEKLGRLKIYNPKSSASKDSAIVDEDIDGNKRSVESEEEDCEIIAVLSGDDAKYELRNRAEIYYDSVSRTVPDEDYVLEEYSSDIN